MWSGTTSSANKIISGPYQLLCATKGKEIIESCNSWLICLSISLLSPCLFICFTVLSSFSHSFFHLFGLVLCPICLSIFLSFFVLPLHSFNLILSQLIFLLKSYRDFHEDLFPDTFAREASMTAEEWFSGSNNPVSYRASDPCVIHVYFICSYLNRDDKSDLLW